MLVKWATDIKDDNGDDNGEVYDDADSNPPPLPHCHSHPPPSSSQLCYMSDNSYNFIKNTTVC